MPKQKRTLKLKRRFAQVPISIRPYEGQIEKLRRIAESEGVDVSNVLRSAFDLAIETHEATAEAQTNK